MDLAKITALLSLGLLAVFALACNAQPNAPAAPASVHPVAETGMTAALFPGEKAISPGAGQYTPSAALKLDETGTASPGQIVSTSDAKGENALGIVVGGSGQVSAAPDIAILELGVSASAPSVAAARADAADAMKSVMDVLKEKKVADKDIQTRFFSINPKYSYREVTRCPEDANGDKSGSDQSQTSGAKEGPTGGIALDPAPVDGCYTESESVISGYEVGNQLSVKLRDLETVGDIIDAVVEAGGNDVRVHGIDFSLDDPSTLEDEALAAAIKDAMSKAADIAETAGVELGDLRHISESASGQPGFPQFAMLESAAFKRGTSISGGSLEVSATVQALFAIKGKAAKSR